MWNCIRGHTNDVVIYHSTFRENPFFPLVSEPQGPKFYPFPLLWLLAFTTAGTINLDICVFIKILYNIYTKSCGIFDTAAVCRQ